MVNINIKSKRSLQFQTSKARNVNNELGFTIVELLVVIVVIAILTAVAVVSYNGVVQKTIESSMKSDLRNGATALEVEKITTGSYPASAAAVSNGQGLKSSGTNIISYLGGYGVGPYCLNITNSSSSTSFHLNSGNGQISPGTCGTWITTFAGSVSGFADGPGVSARFTYTYGMTVDAAGNLYVADSNSNHCIRKITPAAEVSTLAGLCGSSGNAEGAGSIARFYNPRGVTVDSSGNVFVSDSSNHCIRRITPAGAVTTFAGLCGTSGNVDSTGAAARFSYPHGITVDSSGNLYVSDASSCIRKITSAAVVTTFAGLCGTLGLAEGTGATARFSFPEQVALDSSDNLYVADDGNNRIRKITPAAIVTTFAGSTSGYVDGTGAAARFDSPDGVAVDASDNVYVSDSDNNRIRRITPGGVVTTVLGNGACTSNDGPGVSATICWPQSLVVAPSGDIYSTDFGCRCIRKIVTV